jgi:hypothetical protein
MTIDYRAGVKLDLNVNAVYHVIKNSVRMCCTFILSYFSTGTKMSEHKNPFHLSSHRLSASSFGEGKRKGFGKRIKVITEQVIILHAKSSNKIVSKIERWFNLYNVVLLLQH